VKDKTNIRYLGFRSANNGGRLFDFSISAAARADTLTCFEIPACLFTGDTRIRLQEGVGICYAKLKDLLEISALTDLPEKLCLTEADLDRYREVTPSKRRIFPLSRKSDSGPDSDSNS
jgi:hypothetical protein